MAGVRDDVHKCPTAGVQSKWRQAGGRRTAKLTILVNIAVFAAFRWCVGHILRASAEFKRLCRSRPLDVSRYGWQKRQETAMKWQGNGTVGGKNGTVRADGGGLHAAM